MTRRPLALLASAALAVTALAVVTAAPAGAATAARPTGLTYGAPVASLVDRHGTSFVLVQDGQFYPVLYRRASGAKTWVRTKIPKIPSISQWHLFAPTAGQLWITAEEQASDGSDGNAYVARSTNGGTTWTKANLSKFDRGGSLGIASMAITGNLVANAHFTDGSARYIRLRPDLTGYSAWPAGVPAYTNGAAVAGDGTLLTWNYATPTSITVTAGTHTATVSFPCTLASSFSGPASAVGTSALTLAAACNSGTQRVYVRRVSTHGVVGKATLLGTSNGTVQAAAGPGNAAAVAWALPAGGDWASAHLASGTTWTRTAGELPVALGGTHSGTAGTFLVGNRYLAFGTYDNRAWATPLSAAATAPAAPTHGVAHPLVLRLGTGAAVTASRVSAATLRRTGVLTVKVRTTVTDTVTVQATTNRKNSGYYYIYSGSASKTVRAGRTVTFTLHLSSGGTVIGGSAGNLPLTNLRRGDAITFTLSTRNGSVNGLGKAV